MLYILKQCLNDSGTSFIPEWLHLGPYLVSMFIYMIPTKVLFWNKSFQNEFIPVVALDRHFHFGTKSGERSTSIM